MAANFQHFEILAEAVRSLKPVVVPPPKVFNGTWYHSISDFIHFFEKYCKAIYVDDQFSWLQVLPDFLAGQYKSIDLSFGISSCLEYGTVKAQRVFC